MADGPRCRIGLLGPMLVTIDGADRVINAPRQRAVLARLAVSAGEPVSADVILHDVWGHDTPTGGARAVAFQVARLRDLLEPNRDGTGSFIETVAAGYRLRVDPEQIDLHHFDSLVSDARTALATDPGRARTLTLEALDCWRSTPFADITGAAYLDDHLARLDQRRLLAQRTLIEARLAIGDDAELIPEIEQLIHRHPLEEALVRDLMIALHRSGRTADGLQAYGDLRRRLGQELGIEPSRELQQLEGDLLRGQPIEAAAAVTERAEPRTAGAGVTGFGAGLSSFVGRRTELATIESLLTTARLVTLCGFGGLGKTRLAEQSSLAATDRFDHGVWFVDLTPIDDREALADAFIAAGDIGIATDTDPADHLVAHLASRQLLLVVDNCEHVADAVAALLTRILRTAPEVRVLATSRISLGVDGESVVTVQPLAAPVAIELFTDRAEAARPGFVLDGANRAAVQRICRLVDGIPLALEMVAARLSVMEATDLAEHLDDRFSLLTRPRPGAGGRQASLTSIMDWSHDLLADEDRQLLGRLSCCAGGFDLDAVRSLATTGHERASLAAVVDPLARLVEAALVRVDRGTDQAEGITTSVAARSRYSMLETVRQYGAERLTDDERYGYGLAHATHYAAVAAELDEAEHSDRLARGARELGNLRAAMGWAYDNGHPRLGLSIIYRSRQFLWANMMHRETQRWLMLGLDQVDDDGPETLRCAAVALVEAFNTGTLAGHGPLIERVGRGLDATSDPEVRSMLLAALGTSHLDTDPRAADRYFQDADEPGSVTPIRALALLSNRIEASWLTGRVDDEPAIVHRLSDLRDLAPGPTPLVVRIEAGLAARAGRWHEVLEIAGRSRGLDPSGEASIRILEAEALGGLGRHDAAVEVLDRLDLDAGGHYIRAANLVRTSIDLQRGASAAAATRLLEMAAGTVDDGRDLAVTTQVAAQLGAVATDLERLQLATELLGFSLAERARLDIVLRPVDRDVIDRSIETCRLALGPEAHDALLATGAAAGWAELVQRSRTELSTDG